MVAGIAGVHSIGIKWRASAGAFAALWRWPHERQIAPIWCFSVSFDISFSREASEPVTTGP